MVQKEKRMVLKKWGKLANTFRIIEGIISIFNNWLH